MFCRVFSSLNSFHLTKATMFIDIVGCLQQVFGLMYQLQLQTHSKCNWIIFFNLVHMLKSYIDDIVSLIGWCHKFYKAWSYNTYFNGDKSLYTYIDTYTFFGWPTSSNMLKFKKKKIDKTRWLIKRTWYQVLSLLSPLSLLNWSLIS